MTFSLAGVPADQARFFAPDALAPWATLHKVAVGRPPRLRQHPTLPGVSLWSVPAAADGVALLHMSLVFRDHPRMNAEVESWGLVVGERRTLEALPQPASWVSHVASRFGDGLGLRLVDVGGDAVELSRAVLLSHLLRGELPAELTTASFVASLDDPADVERFRPALGWHVAAPLLTLGSLAVPCVALPRDVLSSAGAPLAAALGASKLDENALEPVVSGVRKALTDFCQSLWWQVTEADRFPARARAESERLAAAFDAVRRSLDPVHA